MAACAAALLAGAPAAQASAAPVVEVGLERLAAERGGALRGRRVGLVAHAASVTRDGRHAIDVLRAAGVVVARVFAPEHGLRGAAAAGEHVASGVDPVSGLRVISLYGERQRPRLEDLRGLDALVVDLQDAGVRFYTYAGTLMLCLEAAAEAGVELVVLDRPNPLGGERVEGPPADSPPAGRTPSLLSMAPGTLVHGLTLGELARFVNARLAPRARLRVVPLRGFRRAMTWNDTGRAWVAPSPNLRSAEAALVYPGVALLEATNLSEGRGTDTPFLLLGAPWLSPATARELAAVLASVAGLTCEPARFTPRASPAAPEPKHAGVECAGLRLRVSDARALSPYALGVRLLHALRRLPGFEWRDGGAALERLMGTRALRLALERGEAPEDILQGDEAGRATWRRARAAALLY